MANTSMPEHAAMVVSSTAAMGKSITFFAVGATVAFMDMSATIQTVGAGVTSIGLACVGVWYAFQMSIVNRDLKRAQARMQAHKDWDVINRDSAKTKLRTLRAEIRGKDDDIARLKAGINEATVTHINAIASQVAINRVLVRNLEIASDSREPSIESASHVAGTGTDSLDATPPLS